MGLLRVVMFCVIGLVVSEIEKALGSDPAMFAVTFVLAGIGGVVAMDVFLWLRRHHSDPTIGRH